MAGMFGGVGTIKIGKVTDPPMPGFLDVRIDRHTLLGNEFRKSEVGSRVKACSLHRADSKNRMKKSKYRKRILELRALYYAGQNILLRCHCFPKKCHGETVRDEITGDI